MFRSSQLKIVAPEGNRALLKPVHSDRITRFLGRDKAEELSSVFRDWYGPPVRVFNVPGCVSIAAGGEFVGEFNHGSAAGFFDMLYDEVRRRWLNACRFDPAVVNAGFSSIGAALSRASQGYDQLLGGNIQKTGPTGVSASCSSLWRLGASPVAGGAGAAAPGGTAHTKSDTGAMKFNNPASGTLHLTGADFAGSVANNAVMIYDRLFSVAKTMNSTGTEAVTGVPTRYQSSTATDPDYAGGNFLFIEVGGTALAATAHNWTTCLYRDEDNNDNQTLPSVTGNSGAIVDRFDMPTNTWFCPLASGDIGIKDLAQMQCSAAVATGAVNFVIGHPLGVMGFPIATTLLPFTWLSERRLAPRIFDDACIALFELPKPSTTATSYTGQIYATQASA